MEAGILEDLDAVHSHHSVLRERIVEHVFVGEALRRCWQLGITDVEVLRSEFDAGGYDLVMSRKSVTRHIQLKTRVVGGKASEVKIGMALAERPSGCVLWIVVTPGLETQSYLWFGSEPGIALPDISSLKIAKHTKANSQGEKTYKPNHRLVPRSWFTPIHSIDEVLAKLFGRAPAMGSIEVP